VAVSNHADARAKPGPNQIGCDYGLKFWISKRDPPRRPQNTHCRLNTRTPRLRRRDAAARSPR